jgi:hypothetical protein
VDGAERHDARTGLAIQAESLGHAARQMSLPLRHIRRRKRRSLMTSTVIPIAIAAFLSGAVADPLPEDCARPPWQRPGPLPAQAAGRDVRLLDCG